MSTKSEITEIIAVALNELGATTNTDQIDELLTRPPRPELGDLAMPCFVFAKALRRAPQQIAQQLAEAVSDSLHALPAVKSAGAEGPYFNIHLDTASRAATVLKAAVLPDFGDSDEGAGKTVGIDFSSPNIAKPFGIGHLRSTSIGAALGRIFEKRGYKVVGINHLGDWGTQFGKLMAAWKRWGDEEALESDPIQHLYELYVRFHKEAETDEALLEDGRAWFRRLENGDDEAQGLWQRFRDLSLREFNRIYERLGVSFDHYWGEAFYNDKMQPLVDDIKAAGILEESEGAQVVSMEHLNLPPCLVLKNDGASLYATRDLAAARYRYEALGFEKFLYVVGAEQSVHFQQVFEVLKLMKYPWADRLVHIPFGRIQGISTRKGTLVFLEDILERGAERVREVMAERDLPEDERELITEQITVGAIVFYDLSRNRIKDYDFDWDLMLRGLGPNERGQTGPYLQYTHTRLVSLLDSYRETFGQQRPDAESVDFGLLDDEGVRAIVSHLEAYPAAVAQAARDYEPSAISRYALDLAEHFNSFYSGGNRFISEDRALSDARILVADAVRQTLAGALSLLGVPLPRRM